jgi:branched-chain amino acid transport system substrate-binding protein
MDNAVMRSTTERAARRSRRDPVQERADDQIGGASKAPEGLIDLVERERTHAMNSLLRSIAAVFAPMALALAGPVHAADLKVGLLLSQTGPLSSYGVPMKSAAEYAAKVINDAGGIDGKKLIVIVEDDTSNPTTFLNGLNRLIDSEKVLALVGPITSGFFQAGAPVVHEAGVGMISPTATAPNLTTGNPDAFRNNPSEDVNIANLLKLIKSTHPEIHSISVIYDNKEAADKVIGGLYEKLAPQTGWSVQAVSTFLSGQLNYSDVVAKSLRSKPDVVAVAAHAEDAGNVARELRRQGYKGLILGGTPTVSQDYIKIGGEAANDTYVVVPYFQGAQTEQNAKFVAGYTKFTSRASIDPWEASTFECIGMIVQAMRAAGVTGDPAKVSAERNAVAAKLAATRGYPGLVGKIDFDKDRVAEKPALIIHVQGLHWQAL